VGEYVSRFYLPASKQGAIYAENDFENAKRLAVWKGKVRSSWQNIALRRLDVPKKHIQFGDAVRLEVAVQLDGLVPEDVVVELLLHRPAKKDASDYLHFSFACQGIIAETGECRFTLDLSPDMCGRLDYKVRAYPHHPLLTHPLEMGLMLWL